MMEQIANNASTTLSGSVNGSSNPVTLTVSSASGFPSSGNFRIIIDSEILLVTAVSGTSWTCTRAQDGTTIAAHSSSTAVTHILTKSALQNVINEFFGVGTYANRPAAGFAGRKYFATDGPYTYVDDGTQWTIRADEKMRLCYPPVAANFPTNVNTSRSGTHLTIDNAFDALRIIDDMNGLSSGEYNEGIVTSSLASTFTCTVALRLRGGINASFVVGGIMLYDGTKVAGLCINQRNNETNPRFAMYEWSNPTTYSNTVLESYKYDQYSEIFWLRLQRTASNTYSAFESNDGLNWNCVSSGFSWSGMTAPTGIGLFKNGNTGSTNLNSNDRYGADFLHYDLF